MEARKEIDLSQYLEYLNQINPDVYRELIEGIDNPGDGYIDGRLFSDLKFPNAPRLFNGERREYVAMTHNEVVNHANNIDAINEWGKQLYINAVESQLNKEEKRYKEDFLDAKTITNMAGPLAKVEKEALDDFRGKISEVIAQEFNTLWENFIKNNKDAFKDISDEDKIKLKEFTMECLAYHLSGAIKAVVKLDENLANYPALDTLNAMVVRYKELTNGPNLNAMKEGPAKDNRRASLRDFGKRITSSNLGYRNTSEKKQKEEKEVKVDTNENRKTENEILVDKKRSRFAAARSITQKNVVNKEDKKEKVVKEDKNADKKEHKNKGSMFSSLSIFKPYPDDSKDKGKAKEKKEDNSNEIKHKM